MVLLMDLTHSFASYFSALCMILSPWGVLMLVFSLRLVGVYSVGKLPVIFKVNNFLLQVFPFSQFGDIFLSKLSFH